MARAVYQHELQDQDFSWLIQRFQETNPEYVLVESSVLPVTLFRGEKGIAPSADIPMVLGPDEDGSDEELFQNDPES